MTGAGAFSRLPAGAGGTFHPAPKAVRVASFPARTAPTAA